MSDQFVFYEDNKDEFKMWQGLKGPYYTPYVDENGNLSWTNNGGLPNPATVNIKGAPGTGLEIKGIVESVSALPATAASGDVYLVGSEPPYDGYLYVDGGWTYIGVVGVGENGRGIVSITKTGTSGLVDTYTITYTDGINPTTFTVTNGAPGSPGVGVPTGGTTGQILAKASGTDYDTEWVNQSAGVDPATATPLMDGTGAVGSSAKYAREDHRHPSDTAKQDALVSGTNIKTVNGQSLLGSGNLAAIPTGGAAGKALVKASATNYDVTWGDAGGALWFTGVTVSATTGDIVTITDSAITADHVLGRIEWTNPSAISTNVTWTTANGSLVLNGTCTSATTANIVLVKKNN